MTASSRVNGANRPLVLVTSQLCLGGAERVVATMASWWANEGRKVTVVVLRARTPEDYLLDSRVKCVFLDIIGDKNPWWDPRMLFALSTLRRAILSEFPSVVIGFQDKLNVALLTSLVGTSFPIWVTEHVVPWECGLRGFWRWARRFSYRWAEAVVSPSQSISAWLSRELGRTVITLRYPPRQIEAAVVGEENGERKRLFFAAGRLVHLKGFDLLLRAFAVVSEELPDWTISIAGQGPEAESLGILAHELGIASRVTWLGQVTNMDQHFRKSEVFVLSSRTEAFPMVLTEAMAAGCAVIATDCPVGPREMVGDAAILVANESPEELGQALLRLGTNQHLRKEMQARARAAAIHFRAEVIMGEWTRNLGLK